MSPGNSSTVPKRARVANKFRKESTSTHTADNLPGCNVQHSGGDSVITTAKGKDCHPENDQGHPEPVSDSFTVSEPHLRSVSLYTHGSLGPLALKVVPDRSLGAVEETTTIPDDTADGSNAQESSLVDSSRKPLQT